MEDLNIQVLQGFGVKAKRIVKEKSYYICNTDKGFKVVRKSFDTRERIIFQQRIKEHLWELGFTNTDVFTMSDAREPFFEFDNNIYVMTDLLDFRESDFSSNEEFEKIIENVGEFHSVGKNIEFKQEVYYGNGDMADVFKRSLSEFNLIKKRLGNQKRMSDFDVLFLKNYNFYLKQIEKSIELLIKTDYGRYSQEAKAKHAICHNLLKEENILVDKDRVYLTSFSHTVVDYFLPDLSAIIQRYVKGSPQNRLSAQDIIKHYAQYNPIGQEEISMLYPLLLYPSKYIKLCNQYYSKKRSWTPNAIINRMDNIINNRESYYDFVNELEN